jgi:hypothetical protein
MNGLLHRLAARATGTTAQVRSDARLPFGGIEPRGSGLLDAGDEQGAASDVRAEVSNVSTASAQLHEEAQSRAPALLIEPSLHGLQVRRADAAPHAVQSARGDVQPIQPNAGPPAERSVSQNYPPPLADRVPAEASRAIRLDPATGRETDFRAVAVPALDAPDDGTARFTGDPSLLMPLADSRRSAVSPITGNAPTRRPAEASSSVRAIANDEPNEVHIHIGRIDVTAMHEPAPSRRRPAPTASPMSLDTYFAKRGRT